jgi:hypothetical protein
MSSAAATLCAQRADSAALLQAEAAEVERRPPSAQLASAMRGRPSLATRTRTQDSARKRQLLANEESQRQALAEQTQREDTARRQLEEGGRMAGGLSRVEALTLGDGLIRRERAMQRLRRGSESASPAIVTRPSS